MFNYLQIAARRALVALALSTGLIAGERAFCQVVVPQNTTPYWGNHWNWYNNTYRPYYERQGRPVWRDGYAGPGYYYAPYGSPAWSGVSPFPSGRVYNGPGGPTIDSGLFPRNRAAPMQSPYGWW